MHRQPHLSHVQLKPRLLLATMRRARLIRRLPAIAAIACLTPTLDARAQANLAASAVFSAEVQIAGQEGRIINTNMLPPLPESPFYNFGGTTVTAGRRIQLAIGVSNSGPNTASAVRVKFFLPPGVSPIENTLNGQAGGGNKPGRCILEPNSTPITQITCQYDSLTTAETINAQLQMLVDPGFPRGTQLSMDGRVESDTADPNTSNNIIGIQYDVQPFSDFQVTTAAAPGTVVAGETAHYRITLVNNGPSTATGISLVNALTAGGEFLHLAGQHVLGAAADCYQDEFMTPDVNCDLGDILPGRTVTIDLDMAVDAGAPDATMLTDAVTLAGQPTIQVRNVQDVGETIATTTSADLRVTNETLDAVAIIGEQVVYALSLVNRGPSDAQGVTLTHVMPAELNYLADTGGGMEMPDGTIAFDLGAVAAGETRAILVLAQVSAATADGMLLTADATVASTTPDPAAGNNTARSLSLTQAPPTVIVNLPPQGPPVVNVNVPAQEPPVVNVQAPAMMGGGLCGIFGFAPAMIAALGTALMRPRRRVLACLIRRDAH